MIPIFVCMSCAILLFIKLQCTGRNYLLNVFCDSSWLPIVVAQLQNPLIVQPEQTGEQGSIQLQLCHFSIMTRRYELDWFSSCSAIPVLGAIIVDFTSNARNQENRLGTKQKYVMLVFQAFFASHCTEAHNSNGCLEGNDL